MYMPYSHYPSLFIVLNSERARWYLLNGRGAHEIAYIVDPFERYSDRESFFGQAGGGPSMRHGEPDVINARKQEHLLYHLRAVGKKTAELCEKNDFRYVTCALPEEIKYEFIRQVPFLKDSLRLVYGNFVSAREEDIASMFVNSLKPY